MAETRPENPKVAESEAQLARAARALEDAKLAATRAEKARQSDARSAEETQRAIAEVDAKILATAFTETRALARLDGERGGLRVALEVLTRARVPKSEAAAAEAERALAEAQREHDEAERVAELERRRAERAQIEAALTERVRAFRIEVEPLVRELGEAWQTGGRLARALGEGWPDSPWPSADDAPETLFAALGRAITPPPPPREPTREELTRENERLNERAREDARIRQWLADAQREREGEQRRRGAVQDSGMDERERARMQAAEDERRRRHNETFKEKLARDR